MKESAQGVVVVGRRLSKGKKKRGFVVVTPVVDVVRRVSQSFIKRSGERTCTRSMKNF